jgi:glucose-1-phosphate thymidylyltransferase
MNSPIRKGIILAGGTGSRLYPATLSLSKQLLPLYDKPMIYYPLSILMQLGIRDILVVATPAHLPIFMKLLQVGHQFGVHLQYLAQPFPDGIAKPFVQANHFINDEPVAMILGDNIFYGDNLIDQLKTAMRSLSGAHIFAYPVADIRAYGAVKFDQHYQPIALIEKPAVCQSGYAVTGLYYYDNQVSDFAHQIEHSYRGELEITDINQCYLNRAQLMVDRLDAVNTTWFDLGSAESLLMAAQFVAAWQKKENKIMACLEAIAYQNQWISQKELATQVHRLPKNDYQRYLLHVLEGTA